MFDFVKLANSDEGFADKLRQNEFLEFKRTYNERTAELEDPWEAEYNDLLFILYPSKRVEISGSLHKYRNNGKHNYDDFTIEDVKEVLLDLEQRFNINPNTTTAHHLEYGLNVQPRFNPNRFLGNLICFKNKPFQNMKTFGKAYAKEAISTQYKIKIYNKALRYNLNDNTLRFEQKVNKMESIQKGKVFLSELTSDVFIEKCFVQLFESFKNLIVMEELKPNIPRTDRRDFDNYDNPRFWEKLSKSKRHYHKQRFESLKNEYGKETLKNDILKLMEEKQKLVYPKSKKRDLLTDTENLKTLPFDSLINKSTGNRLAIP